MRSYTHAFPGLVLGVMLAVLAGCGQDDSAPAVHNKDLGAQPGEVLVPYEPVISKKVTAEPSQYPLPQPAVAAAAEAAEQAAAPAGGAEEDEYAVAIREIVANLAKGEFTAVVARFDEKMSGQIPEAQIQSTWEMLVNQAGAFEKITGVSREQAQVDGQIAEVATATCKFERGAIDVRVAFNPQKQISGLFMAPPGPAKEAPPTSEPAGEASPAEAPVAEGSQGASAPAGDSPAGLSSSSNGLGELPPTAPAPVGLGN